MKKKKKKKKKKMKRSHNTFATLALPPAHAAHALSRCLPPSAARPCALRPSPAPPRRARPPAPPRRARPPPPPPHLPLRVALLLLRRAAPPPPSTSAPTGLRTGHWPPLRTLGNITTRSCSRCGPALLRARQGRSSCGASEGGRVLFRALPEALARPALLSFSLSLSPVVAV